jgi:hypothetical protein
MAAEFELITSDDKPALMALSTPEYISAAQAALEECGFKIHCVRTHEEFPPRYGQIPYQVVVTEERFAGSGLGANETLKYMQELPMPQRRHTTFFLIGQELETLHPKQAYVQSVHAVINAADIGKFAAIIQKVVAENDAFMFTFRDVLTKLQQGKG